MSRSSCAVLYLGRGEVLGREPQTGDEGGASRGARPRPPCASSRPPSGPAHPATLPCGLTCSRGGQSLGRCQRTPARVVKERTRVS